MEAISLALLPAFAEHLALKFPELKGRCLAVSEIDITKENKPTLPICLLAFTRELGNGVVRTGQYTPAESFIVEFWYEPERYKSGKGTETPFWSYYDYDALRDRFLTVIRKWLSPRGARVQYVSMEIDVDAFAVVVSFQCTHTFEWCEPEDGGEQEDGFPANIGIKRCIPDSFCSGPEDPREEEPCP